MCIRDRLLPAALLCDEPCTVENLPDIRDVRVLARILEQMGASVDYHSGCMTLDPRCVTSREATYDLIRPMRAPYYLLGAMLGKFGEAQIALPGGCEIGQRPIDQHLKGMEALGAEVEVSHGFVSAKAPQGDVYKRQAQFI